MGSWRSKLIFLLIVYFAGFATAIYTLAPAPEKKGRQNVEKRFAYSALKSEDFAQSFNVGMHKCLDFARAAALHTGDFLKQKLDEKYQADG